MTNYYKVAAYNKDVEKLMLHDLYVGLIDSFPPMPPIGLEGRIDTAGIATIKWQANTESDLSGYRVYVSNSANAEFALLTPDILSATTYRHKINLKTLTRDVFYQVRAIDKRDNHSQPSETLVLHRPDIVPPVAPIITSISTDGKYPKMQWMKSSSDDVSHYRILRHEIDVETMDTIATVATQTSSYEDKTIVEGVDYIYVLFAEDYSGNKSKMTSVMYHTDYHVNEKIKAKRFTDADGMHLTWTNVNLRKAVDHYLIFKAEGEKPLMPYTTTTDTKLIDKEILIGQKYQYAIKIIYADGTESGVIEF